MPNQFFSLREGLAQPVGANRRATIRYRCAPATPGRLIVPDQDQEFQQGWLLDLSTKGVGLLVNRVLEMGTFVVVKLKSLKTNKVYDLAALVAHSTFQSNGDLVLGLEFVQELTLDDLEDLL